MIHDVAAAVEHVRRGGLLAYPTETLYGLGADARSEAALGRLRRWKGSDATQPVSLLVADAESLDALDIVRTAASDALIARFWPGPVTLILATRGAFAAGVANAAGAIGVRCSPHPVAHALARALAAANVGPLTATSLNRHGAPAAATRAQAMAMCDDAPDAPRLFAPRSLAPRSSAAETEPSGLASTLVDASSDTVRVLREGAVAAADVYAAIGHSPRAASARDGAAAGSEPEKERIV